MSLTPLCSIVCIFFIHISVQSVRWNLDPTRQDSQRFPARSCSLPTRILWDRYSAQTNIRLTDWYMRMPDVLIVAICMKHRPEQQREITYFFDAWIPLLSLVHGKFSWAAGSVMVPLNGFTLHYLCGRPGVMDEVQGWKQKAHLHLHDKVPHKGEAEFFERGPSQSFHTHGLHKQLWSRNNQTFFFWGKLMKTCKCKYKYNQLLCVCVEPRRHKIALCRKQMLAQTAIHAFSQQTTAQYNIMRKYLTNTFLIMVWPLV